MRTSTYLRALLLCAGLCAMTALPGCHGDDPGQIDTLQRMAHALRSKRPRIACLATIKSLHSDIGCDSVIINLLHYSPGFPGSTVSRRAHSSGWRRSTVVKVPIHYEGPDGKGNLDVTMHKEDGQWRVALMVPVP